MCCHRKHIYRLNLNQLKFGRRFMHPIEWCVLLVFLTMLLSTATGVAWNYRTEFLLDKMSKVFLFTFLLSHIVVTRKQIWYLVILFTVMTLYLGHEAKIAPIGSFSRNRLNGIGGPDFRESAGLAIHRNEEAGRTVLELEGVILGWWTDRQQLEGGELVIDWNQIEEAARLALSKEEGWHP